ncbi:MAG: SDR family oxidoreductase [Caldimonas sp.]
MEKKVCIVAGALGIVGRAFVEHLDSSEEWEVIALSRRAPDFDTRARFVSIDLLDAEDCHSKLRELGRATHVFYAAYAPRATAAEEVAPNLAMVCNLVSAIEKVAPHLAHVQLVQGSKWYGNHLGPYRTPAREDDPRHMPPDFYYDQQDWLENRQRGKSWTWSALRPHCICGLSVGSPMNHLMALSLYASVSRELGLPLRFPGSTGAFAALYQFTDARLLARAMVWAATTSACENQAFNMTNGEPTRWENIWPVLADCFGMQPGRVQTISLARMMVDKEPLWTKMRATHGLRDYTLARMVSWEFADWSYSNSFDQISSLAKARRAGWNEVLDAETMFREQTRRLVADRVIPAPGN